MIYTAEATTFMHSDKICDQISDAILDACLEQDPFSRVAVETIGGHNTIILIGEVTTKTDIDFADIARQYYKKLTNKDIGVLCNIVKQSLEISQGVNKGGAGDQGIMIGYACNENEMYIPQELYLAKKILKPFKTDGKSQVTLDNGIITDVVLSVQNKSQDELNRWIKKCFKELQNTDFSTYCNNTGAFTIGGFDSDSGCTGRKIVVDAYGPRVPVGGGCQSGKDCTKVDRSGAYMARHIALYYVKKLGYNEALVKLAYVIGKVEPVMAIVETKQANFEINQKDFDCRPQAIIERFDLRRPIYLQTAREGHFGNKDYPWEKI